MVEQKIYHRSESDNRRIDTLTDEIHFRAVFSLASDVCFGRQLDLGPYEIPRNEVTGLVSTLGLRGLRGVLDSAIERPLPVGEPPSEHEDGSDVLWVDAPYRFPEYMSDAPRLDLIQEAKQFGQELLATAYLCLGQDVHSKIRELQEAATEDEQVAVLAWLYERCYNMTQKTRGLTDDAEDNYYHPIRLSPRAIGKYPSHALSPTCLGISVIAASFFEQASIEYMHMGVMRTRVEAEYLTLVDMLDNFATIIENSLEEKLDIPDAIYQKMSEVADGVFESVMTDRGFHAANVVKLKESWYIFDSNFHVVSPIMHSNIEEAYAHLNEFRDTAPGLEVSVQIHPSRATSKDVWMLGLYVLSHAPQYNRDELRAVMTGVDVSVIERFHEIVMPELERVVVDDLESEIPGSAAAIGDILAELGGDAFYECFEKYVLWGEAIDIVQKRCVHDESYIERRLNDIEQLWVPIVASVTIKLVNALRSDFHQLPHVKIEGGLPAQRIGLAVLKEFDNYCGGDVSPSFWVSNWASSIPVIDAIALDSPRPGQHSLAKIHAASVRYSSLQYTKGYDIISEFISSQKEVNDAEGRPQDAG